MPMFIVDRVLTGSSPDLVAEAQRCLLQAVRRVCRDGERVRYLRCTFLPDQQRCLDLFEAVSIEQVRHVNDVAQVPFQWVGHATETAAPGTAPASPARPASPPDPRGAS
jgi:hypothetical protein